MILIFVLVIQASFGELLVKNPFEDYFVGKDEKFSIDIPMDTFVSTDNHRVYLTVTPNENIKASVVSSEVVGGFFYFKPLHFVTVGETHGVGTDQNGLKVFDLSDLTQIKVLHEIPVNNPKYVVLRDENLMIVPYQHGLQFYDISDILNPLLVSKTEDFPFAYNPTFTPDLNFYMIGSSTYSYIYNITDIHNIERISKVTLSGTQDGRGCAWSREHNALYIGQGTENCRVYDTTDLDNVVYANEIGSSWGSVPFIFHPHDPDLLLYGDAGTLRVYNISEDPFDPPNIGSVVMSSGNVENLFFSDGNYVYVSTSSSSDAVKIVSISDPSSPYEVTTVDVPESASVFVDDDSEVLYNSGEGEGFQIYNLSDLNTELGNGDGMKGYNARSIALDGDHVLYVSDSNGGLRMFDVEYTDNITEITTVNWFGPSDPVYNRIEEVYFENGYLFTFATGCPVDNCGCNTGVFYIFDATNKTFNDDNGRVTGVYLEEITRRVMRRCDDENDSPLFVETGGDYVYFSKMKWVVNVTDKSEEPNVLSQCGEGGNQGVFKRGEYVYFGEGSDGVKVYKLSEDKSSCTYQAKLGTNSAGEMYVDETNQYLYVTDDEDGMVIIDVSSPSQGLEVVGSVEGGEVGRLSEVKNNLIALSDSGDHFSGVLVADVSDVSNPQIVSTVTMSRPYGVIMRGNYLFVADDSAGWKIVRMDLSLESTDSFDTFCGNTTVEITGRTYNNESETISFVIVKEDYCNGRGTCQNDGICVDCSLGWEGDECDTPVCNQTCQNGGSCCSPDECCGCDEGWAGTWCELPVWWSCDGVDFDDYDRVCGGHGLCTRSEWCECQEGYFGEFCGDWRCGKYDYDEDKKVCSGRGECSSPELCECDQNFEGSYCETNLLYYSVLTPTLTISSFLFVLLLSIFVFLCCSYCVSAIVVASCISYLLCRTIRQTKGLRRFGKLKNFDLLLHEQELEDNESIAHLRIKRDLFAIPFKDLQLLQIIGEGGSTSTVFKASWEGKIVAFKSFRTRSVCETQDSFNEFEKEVEILGSVSHPNILTFYGCSLEPPRVGIVMEFCENGDLEFHISNYNRFHENQVNIPIDEKFRFMEEISSAMVYLHKRNVIHRDLKLENVLLDTNMSCKLMDFGLSKIVDRMSKMKTKSIGTSYFMAPEVLKGAYDEKIDVFAFGICMFMILTENMHPYGVNVYKVEMRVATDPELRPDLKEVEKVLGDGESFTWIKKLIERCWRHESFERPSFSEILKCLKNKKIEDEEKEEGCDLDDF